jgi:hypothetical protein
LPLFAPGWLIEGTKVLNAVTKNFVKPNLSLGGKLALHAFVSRKIGGRQDNADLERKAGDLDETRIVTRDNGQERFGHHFTS